MWFIWDGITSYTISFTSTDIKGLSIKSCPQHHRDGGVGVHFNKALDKKLKLKFQNKLEFLWDKKYLSRQDVQVVLNVKDKQLDKLLKTVISKNGEYERESLIRACCGGKLII